MANCHDLFLEFRDNLKVTDTKRSSLKRSKDELRERIEKYFKENHPGYVPDFFIQGSYKMKTIIRIKDDTCDLDDGIHFKCEPDVSPTTLQRWVYQAVEGHTTGGQQHMDKCIRVIYKNDYHIDLPVYKQAEGDEFLFLAVKDKKWDEEESDPKGFVEWYKGKKTDLMTRLVRYLKAWGDNIRNDMPSGLAMTLFAQKYIKPNKRDDISMKDSLIEMRDNLKVRWEAVMPTKPEDDILLKYSPAFKTNFLKALDDFIADAEKAIDESSQLKASKLWRKHLGSRFPLGEDDDASNKSSVIGQSERGIHKPYFFIDRKSEDGFDERN